MKPHFACSPSMNSRACSGVVAGNGAVGRVGGGVFEHGVPGAQVVPIIGYQHGERVVDLGIDFLQVVGALVVHLLLYEVDVQAAHAGKRHDDDADGGGEGSSLHGTSFRASAAMPARGVWVGFRRAGAGRMRAGPVAHTSLRAYVGRAVVRTIICAPDAACGGAGERAPNRAASVAGPLRAGVDSALRLPAACRRRPRMCVY